MKKISAMFSKLGKNEKRLAAGAGLILLVVFMDRVVILPVFTNLTSLSQSIREQEAAIRKSMTVLLRKDSIEQESKEYRAYSVEAKDPEEEMVGLLKEIESVAEKGGVTLVYVKPGLVQEEKGIKKYYSNLECEAPMESVANFFHGIESSTKLLKIEKYQIQPKNKESSIARCTISIYKTVLS